MPLKATTDNASGFFIWFDINNKKEYYATPMNHYYNNILNSLLVLNLEKNWIA